MKINEHILKEMNEIRTKLQSKEEQYTDNKYVAMFLEIEGFNIELLPADSEDYNGCRCSSCYQDYDKWIIRK